MDLGEIGWDDMEWIDLAGDGYPIRAVVKMITSSSIKCWEVLQ
jgi:hypothetical protein